MGQTAAKPQVDEFKEAVPELQDLIPELKDVTLKGVVLSCHIWSPQKGSPRTICGKLCCYGWSPRTKYGCHRWSPRTICGAVSGPPFPLMVPLKLSLEMMSRGSYEVNLANIWIV